VNIPPGLAEKLKLWHSAVGELLGQHGFQGAPEYLHAPARYALNAEGKRLRPALCLAAAEAVSGDWRGAVAGATALEVFHTFTLVHDDIMDEDDLRRGQPTVHKQFDVNRALLSGDALLIYAYDLLLEIDPQFLPGALQRFNQGALDVCRGQAWDMEFETAGDIDLQAYETMIDLKTGALLRLACGLGALLAGGSEAQISHLESYGVLLGRAFQLQDDLLEVISSAEVMGKSLGSDLVNGKQTWLWLDLQEHLDSEQQSELNAILGSDKDLESKRQLVQNWMMDSGTLQRADEQVQAWIQEAENHLISAHLKDSEALGLLAGLILSRKK